ncbi:BspA family leucine-rich repeat surface protein [Bernardetia sp. OM2101]|uniref:BspA family leucine-rich repeat surface protein n=1 Tax=Bernardetia sp. OM2101 TaxID=3344876 RepID=UPI0035CF590E
MKNIFTAFRFFSFLFLLLLLTGHGLLAQIPVSGTNYQHTAYTNTANQRDMAVVDLNNDGLLDVVTVSGSATRTLEARLNNGTTLNVVATPTVAADFNARSLTAGDFDNDGLADVVVANPNSSTLSFYKGNGDGTFQSEASISMTPPSDVPTQVTSVDINNDGNLDLITSHSSGDRINIHLGNGNGSFSLNFARYDVGNQPNRVLVRDFNNDSFLDIIVGTSSAANFSYLENDGSTNFNLHTITTSNTGSSTFEAGDFNSDGNLDLIVGSVNRNEVTIHYGTTNNGASYFNPTFAPFPIGTDSRDISVADLNNDSHLDFLITDYAGTPVKARLGDGAGNFGGIIQISNGQSATQRVEIADMNNDGRLDIVSHTNNDKIVVSTHIFSTFTSTATGGNWNNGTTWVGGVVPTSSSNIIIATTGINKVTVNVNNILANSIQINQGAILDFGNTTGHSISELSTNAAVGVRTLRIASGSLPSLTTNTFITNAGSLIEFYGTTDYGIPTTFTGSNYRNLTISGTSTKSLSGITSINRNLIVNTNAIFDISSSLTINGTTDIFGELSTSNSSTLTYDFVGSVTVASGGTFQFNPSNATFNFGSGIENNGTFDMDGLSNINFLASQTVSGSQPLDINTSTNQLTIPSGVNLTITGEVNYIGNARINGTDGTSQITLGANGILRADGNSLMATGILDASGNNSLVQYTRNGAATVKSSTYHNLQVSTASTKTLGGDIIVNGNLTIDNSVTLDVDNTNNYAIDIKGEWSNNGTFEARNGKVTFSGTGTSQTIGGANNTTFYDVDFISPAANEITLTGTTVPSLTTVENDVTFGGTGTKVVLEDKNFLVDVGLFGFSANSFFVTNGTGTFQRPIPSASRAFPVGYSINTYTVTTVSVSANMGIVKVKARDYLSGTPTLAANTGAIKVITEITPTIAANASIFTNWTSNTAIYNTTGVALSSHGIYYDNGLGSVIDQDITATAGLTTASTTSQSLTANTTYSFAVFVPPSNPFITTWKTDNTGTTSATEILIPLEPNTNYNFTVDWGDSNSDTYNGLGSSLNPIHDYGVGNEGTYTVSITGDFPRIYFNNSGDKLKLQTIEQWGDIAWTSMEYAFYGCSNLTTIGAGATNTPNLGGGANLNRMFSDCISFVGDPNMNNWNTTSVTQMSNMFRSASSFNQNIGSWNTAAVTEMVNMFNNAVAFNNGDIGNTGSNPLNWNTGLVGSMSYMFYNTTVFNQPLNFTSTAAVTDMQSMFDQASIFNQDIGTWDTDLVVNMENMFRKAYVFNNGEASGASTNPLSWNTTTVTKMNGMFLDASAFNQNLGGWDISGITTPVSMENMLNNCGMDQLVYDATLIGWAGQALTPNVQLGAAGRTYCAVAAHNTITSAPNNWTITGDAIDASCFPTQPIGNRGMYFDGVDDQISIPPTAAFDVGAEVTYMMWVKPKRHVLNARLFRRVGGGIDDKRIHINGDGTVRLFLNIPSGTNVNFTTTTQLPLNEWTHIACTYQRNATAKIYFNGMEVASVATTNDPLGNAGTTGALTINDGQLFEGQLDEFKIFTSVRDAGQIQADMASTAINTTGLLGYWDFENGTGANALDRQTNTTQHNGTLTNSPLWALRVKNTNDSGAESFRDVINDANTLAGKNYIDFSIPTATPPYTISPVASALPTITEDIFIDGYSQFGSLVNTNAVAGGTNAEPLIEIEGSTIGGTTTGLTFTNVNATVQGLVINRFGGEGISINGGTVNIYGNFIGTDFTGSSSSSNGSGIRISGGINHQIGGTSSEFSNLISGNIGTGLSLSGGTDNVNIQRNYISTDKTGNNLLASATGSTNGLFVGSGTNMMIGGNTIEHTNIISAPSTTGRAMSVANTGSSNVIIQGNNIGVGADGSSDLGVSIGVLLTNGTTNNILGGTSAAEGNIIANHATGVLIVAANTDNQVVRYNQIYNNGIGINLNTDGNNNQTTPVINTANEVLIEGNCNPCADGDIIDVYVDNISTTAQGVTHIGQTTVSSNTWLLTGSFTLNDEVTTTSTNPTNGTSEFSTAIPVTTPPIPTQPIGNKGMYFDGVDDYVEVTSGFAIDYTQGTVELWVKPQFTTAANRQFLVGLVEFSTTKWAYYLNADRSGVTFFDGTTHFNFAHTFEKNKWHHLAFVDDNAGTINLYIDGNSTPITTFASKINSVASPVLYIGSLAGTEPFLGQIDQIRIFNSVRTSAQIQIDMATNTENGGAAYWNFEEGTGQTVDDLSVNTNIGTLGSTAGADGNDPLWTLRVKNTNDAGAESLREVITQANGLAGKNYIDFSIPTTDTNYDLGTSVWTIQSSVMNHFTREVLIDGYSAFDSEPATNIAPADIKIQIATPPSNNNVRLSGASSITIKGVSIEQSVSSGLAALWLSGTAGHIVEGNHIGVNAEGSASYPATATSGALVMQNSANNMIGGLNPAERNIISGALSHGVRIDGTASSDNTILGNYIGVAADGTTSLRNSVDGIHINTDGTNNNIGDGTAAGSNIIANNGNFSGFGINVDGGSIQNTISHNSIYNNFDDGIILNPAANNDKEAPMITSATPTLISGTCEESGDIIEVFENNTGEAQGRTYLGTVTATGTSWTYSGAFTIGNNITTTATDGATGDTSPFSNALPVANVPEINVQGNGNDIASGTTITSTANDTDFGSILECGTNTIVKTYTIQNTGLADLTVSDITITGTNFADFTLSGFTLPITISASGSQNFTVTFEPSATGTRNAIVSVINNDSDEGIYDFAIEGIGDADTQLPVLTAQLDFTRNVDAGSCTFTNTDIPNGVAADNCSISSYSYVLTGATSGTFSDLSTLVFNSGITTVTWTATDGSGNISNSDDFTVTVEDNELPVLTAQLDFTRNVDAGSCTFTNTDIPNGVATDNCSISSYSYVLTGATSGTFSDLSTLVFNSGITTVTWTATDGSGNISNSDDFTVTVEDNELPVLTAQLDFTRNVDAGSCTFTNTDIPNGVATDNCSISSYSYVLTGATSGTFSDLSTLVFNSGTTTVTWTATDVNGNISTSDEFTVTVNDTQLPTLTAQADFTRDADVGNCSFVNTDIPNGVATDNCSVASYSYVLTGATTGTVPDLTSQVFNVGTTTVTWTATDGSGNISTSDEFTVTVNDTQLPTLTAQLDFTRNVDAGSCTFTNTDIPNGVATDNCSISSYSYVLTGATSGTFSDLSSLVFNSGITTVTWTATDGSGNISNSDDFTVTVEDNIAPTITPISSVTLSPNQGCSFQNISTSNFYIADGTASDNCGIDLYEYVLTGATTGTVSTLENQVFNEGTTTITWMATDINGNISSSSTFTITVVDNQEPPTLTAMPNFTRSTNATNCYYTNRTTNAVTRIPNGTASDNCGVASYRYLVSGATLGDLSSLEALRFNIGVTTVSWTATDRNGNTSSPNTFTVTVTDNQSPTIEAPQSITKTTNLYGCTSTRDSLDIGTPRVSDNCLFRVFNDAPSEFPIGETIVTWTAIDSAGNTATDEQIVTIEEQYYVVPSDSLILVQMYNEMGGSSWTNRWDLNTPVSTWNGIGVRCGKVASINLFGNNLSGRLPSSVLNLARRTESDFSLNIGANRLDFESAEDFVGAIPNFTYSPQGKIYAPRTERVRQTESITFNSQTEGDFNNYQWYKDENPIAGATNWNYTISSAVPSDAGIYVCEITNTVATRLTLERSPITLEVQGFVNPTDSLALVTIFEETGGTGWTNPWVLTDPVATWEGVTVIGDKIRELDLSSRNMSGNLPNVFDDDFFSELRYLSFFDNDLEGQIPASIGAITTLTYLDLDKNNFEGTLPASFGNLVNLQALWLSRNNLTNLPDEIGNLESLQNLYLNDNKFIELPESIGNLGELLVLNASDNELLGLPNSITNLRKLIQFYANRNYISTIPTDVQNLVRLTQFEMNTNNLTALPTGFLQLSSLSIFKISENELEFDDLLPYSNRSYSVFDYAPQAPINEEEDILAILNSSISFTVQTQGSGNNYQWFRNGTSVATTQNFAINRVSNNDVGIYTAQVTNPRLPNLTLQRRSITLNVECQAGLNFEINPPNQTVFCEGQPFGLKLEINEDFTNPQQIRWRKDGVILAFASDRSYTVTSAGKYTAEILTVNGCTALSNEVEIEVLPQPEISIVLTSENVLTSTLNSQESITYQWLKEGVPIENAFERTYTPTETGEYSLLVLTESGCSSVSETIIFTADEVTGIEEPIELRNVDIFPNPNTGNFFIDFGTSTPNGEPTFVLIDAIGRKIILKTERISSTRYKVNTTNLTGGMYYIQIETKDGLAFRKFFIEE